MKTDVNEKPFLLLIARQVSLIFMMSKDLKRKLVFYYIWSLYLQTPKNIWGFGAFLAFEYKKMGFSKGTVAILAEKKTVCEISSFYSTN